VAITLLLWGYTFAFYCKEVDIAKAEYLVYGKGMKNTVLILHGEAKRSKFSLEGPDI